MTKPKPQNSKPRKNNDAANDALKSLLAQAGGGALGAADNAGKSSRATQRDLARGSNPFGGQQKGPGGRSGGISAPRQRKSG